jgi:hypothetical protein
MARRPISKTLSAHLYTGVKALPVALALAASATAPAPAAAASPPPVAFTLSPIGRTSSISLHGTPGRVLGGAVLVRNVSRHPIVVILQRANIQNASNGNADYVTTRLSGAGQWLRLSAENVHLAPGASRRVAYTLSIPTSATGGSHYLGIVAINATDLSAAARKANSRAFTFRVVTRQALPLTIHLPGRLSRSLSLRSVKLTIEPIGAGLMLGLVPGGNELTQGARVHLRILRDTRTIFTYTSTLGQMFPGGGLSYRVPWPGRPTPGIYRLLGTIRPQGSPVIYVDRTFSFSTHSAAQLERVTPPAAQLPATATPGWVWIALGCGAALLIALSLTVLKLARRPRGGTTRSPSLNTGAPVRGDWAVSGSYPLPLHRREREPK